LNDRCAAGKPPKSPTRCTISLFTSVPARIHGGRRLVMTSKIREALERNITHLPCLRIYQFLRKWGVEFPPVRRPRGMKRRPVGKCFSNAARIVQRYENEVDANPYLYAEGLALDRDGMLFEHAWCVRDGFAIDPTLEHPEQNEYLGIIVPNRLLARLQNINRVFDVLTYASGQVFMQRWDPCSRQVHSSAHPGCHRLRRTARARVHR
jgi:hypothetical protein